MKFKILVQLLRFNLDNNDSDMLHLNHGEKNEKILCETNKRTNRNNEIEDHELIETGFYKVIRHPGYLGQVLIFFGTATSLSNWLSMTLMIIPVLFGYLYRIRIEERFMIRQWGQKYLDYQNKTKRLIPWIY